MKTIKEFSWKSSSTRSQTSKTSKTSEEASTYIHAEQSLVPENITTVNKLNSFNAVMWSIHQHCVLQQDFGFQD